MKASIIIPALNEEKDITSIIKRIKKVSPEYEIIVVDDGSTDKTGEKALNAGATVVTHETNQGKGAGMLTGAKHATTPNVVFIDASQFHPEEIPVLLKRVDKKVLVAGKRPFRVMNWQRKINNLLTIIAHFMATGKLERDCLTGFRALKKDDFLSLKLKEKRFQIESEMTFKARKKGMKIRYVPITVDYPPTLTFNKCNWHESGKITAFLCRMVLKSWVSPFTPKNKRYKTQKNPN